MAGTHTIAPVAPLPAHMMRFVVARIFLALRCCWLAIRLVAALDPGRSRHLQPGSVFAVPTIFWMSMFNRCAAWLGSPPLTTASHATCIAFDTCGYSGTAGR